MLGVNDPEARMMGNTKLYLYIVKFASGNVDAPERNPALKQGIWRAREIPGHRIELKASEDHADPQDAGCALRRLDFLLQCFLAGLVDETRLELSDNSCSAEAGSFARRAEIHLFPRVASLFDDGRPLLSREDISALQTAREVVLFPPNAFTDSKRKLLERYTSNDWMRIVGHESLDKWASAGAQHPLYDDVPELGRWAS